MNHAEILDFLNGDYPTGLYFLDDDDSFLAWPGVTDTDIMEKARRFAEANPDAIFVAVEKDPAGKSKKTIIVAQDEKGENRAGLQFLAKHFNLRLASGDNDTDVMTLEVAAGNPSATAAPQPR